MATSLLTEGGVQGGKVVGATGVNNRTGEFMIFKSKATILTTAQAGSIWFFSTELGGYTNTWSRALSGDGIAMAWRAGAELTLSEKSETLGQAAGHKHKWYTGASDASYENVPLVDDNGKELPIENEGWGKKTQMFNRFQGMAEVRDGVMKGEYALPFYGDFSSMPEIERNVTWGLMIGEEATTRIITRTFNEAGFDSSKDMLQAYTLIEGSSLPQWRQARGGGLMIDWDLKSSLDGLYAAGTQIYSPGDHSFAASTGRYAGRKAADYALRIDSPRINREQVDKEKARVYAPVKSSSGIEWKELHAGIARTMQFFCSEYKTEKLFKMGLDSLKEIEERFAPNLYTIDPHKLMRGLEDLSMLSVAQAIMHASMARKASSQPLNFHRIDYPELDPPEWNKFLTIKQENGKVVVGEKPFDYFGDIKKNYEERNKDYTGVYKGK
jgi:succinate dehydrogenase/fumarate reductase flavoprotein subunit